MELYLFDWDGCLADTLPVWLKCYAELYKKYGIETNEEEIIEKSFGKRADGPQSQGVKEYDKFYLELLSNVRLEMKDVQLNPNIKLILNFLKDNKKKIAIISTAEWEMIDGGIRKHQLQDYIDLVIAAKDIEQPKPDPEGINKAIKHFNIEKENSVMIGDTDKDILAGQNAKIKTVLYNSEANERFYHKQNFTELNPDWIIKDFIEIKNID